MFCGVGGPTLSWMGESDWVGRVDRSGRGVVCVGIFLTPRSTHFFLKVHHAVHPENHHAITDTPTPYNYIHTQDPIFFFETLHFFVDGDSFICNCLYNVTVKQ